jgi:hypothetical protein
MHFKLQNDALSFDYLPMNSERLKKAFVSLHRFPESVACLATSPDRSPIASAYIGVQSWFYPLRIMLSRILQVSIFFFENLTSFWSVWFDVFCEAGIVSPLGFTTTRYRRACDDWRIVTFVLF